MAQTAQDKPKYTIRPPDATCLEVYIGDHYIGECLVPSYPAGDPYNRADSILTHFNWLLWSMGEDEFSVRRGKKPLAKHRPPYYEALFIDRDLGGEYPPHVKDAMRLTLTFSKISHKKLERLIAKKGGLDYVLKQAARIFAQFQRNKEFYPKTEIRKASKRGVPGFVRLPIPTAH